MMFQGCSTYDGMLSNKRRQDVLELRLEKLAIHAFGLQQFLMATLLDDLTIRQDHNLIGALHHGQLVGDDDNCVPLHQVIQRFRDHGRCVGIQAGERLIQDDDRGVAHDRPGDGNPLALSAG